MYYVNDSIKNVHRVKHKESRANYLRLDMNENPEGLPKEFFDEVVKKITPEFLAMYPEKERVLELLAKQDGIHKDNISLTNGADEAIRLAFEVFGCEGGKVLTVTPTFEMYDVYANMFGMSHVKVPFDDKLNISVENIIENIDDKTNLVVLLNPNSPIGISYDNSEIEEIICQASKMNSIVLIDEAYFYFHEKTYIDLINKYENVLIIRTFSKLFSLAGTRIGYIAGSKELIHYIENAQPTYNVNSVGLLFAEELLKKPELIKELQAIEREGRDFLINKLVEENYTYFSQEGNYILIKSNRPPKEILEELKRENILIKIYRNGVLKDWIRITTGSIDVMERFWKAFVLIDIK